MINKFSYRACYSLGWAQRRVRSQRGHTSASRESTQHNTSMMKRAHPPLGMPPSEDARKTDENPACDRSTRASSALLGDTSTRCTLPPTSTLAAPALASKPVRQKKKTQKRFSHVSSTGVFESTAHEKTFVPVAASVTAREITCFVFFRI